MYKGVIINPPAPAAQPDDQSERDRRRGAIREAVTVVSVVLAVWAAGLGPAVVSFVLLHQSQVTLAAFLYLIFRYLGWVPLVGLVLLLVSPLFLRRRRGPQKRRPAADA